MLTKLQIAKFQEHGFLNTGHVLNDNEVERLNNGLARVMAGDGAGEPELLRNLAGGEIWADGKSEVAGVSQGRTFAANVNVQIVNMWESDAAYWQLLYHPTITQMAAQLIGCDQLRVWHDQIQYKPPGVGAQLEWHQDFPFWLILEPAELVTAWLALDDATVENGCMRMVPGSHRWGTHELTTVDGLSVNYDPTSLPDDARTDDVLIEVKRGECHFHHCMTWHGSPINRSDQARRAIAIHYMPGHTRYEPNGGHVMEARVEVDPGDLLTGTYFPTVYDGGPIDPPPFRADL